MNTSVELLPAINELYELNLTTEDLNAIITALDPFKELESDIRNKVIFKVRRGNIQVKRTMGGNFNNQSGIAISKMKEDQVAALATVLPDGARRFAIPSGYSRGKLLYFNTLSAKDLEKIAPLLALIEQNEDFTNHFPVFNLPYENINEFLNTLRSLFVANWTHLNSFSYSEEEDIVEKTLTLLLPDAVVTANTEDLKKKVGGSRHLRLISRVYEYSNIRFFEVVGLTSTNYYGSSRDQTITKSLKAVSSDTHGYEYVDVGRLFISNKSVHYRHDRDECNIPTGYAMFIDQNPIIPTDAVIEDFVRTSKSATESALLTNADVTSYVKKVDRRKKREKSEQEAKEKLEAKIKDRISSISNDKPLKINGVNFYPSKIEYEGQELSLTSHTDNNKGGDESNWFLKTWVLGLLEKLVSYYSLDQINWDIAFDRFIELAVKKNGWSGSSTFYNCSGRVGNVKFDISAQDFINKNHVSNTRTYINDTRINKDEVKECLVQGLCYLKQKDYDNFLKSVSKCSLKFHHYLHIGIDIKVYDEFNGCEISMKIPLIRKSGTNYILLNGKEYKVRDSARLINLHKGRDILDVVNTLLGGKVVADITTADIKPVIDEAEKEFRTAKEKSETLLKDTEKAFKIKRESHELDDGKTRTGYLVEGQMGTYLIESDGTTESKNAVYRYPSGRHVCIVDKSNAQVGMDRLVNRIYALHNDTLVAPDIHTLSD